jgi:hypothetical protein
VFRALVHLTKKDCFVETCASMSSRANARGIVDRWKRYGFWRDSGAKWVDTHRDIPGQMGNVTPIS